MSDFSQHYDHTIEQIESRLAAIIDAGAEMDYEMNGAVLTMEFENGEKFVITPQSPTEQLWISANYSGHRFNWSEETNSWVNEKDSEELHAFLSRLTSEKLGETVEV